MKQFLKIPAALTTLALFAAPAFADNQGPTGVSEPADQPVISWDQGSAVWTGFSGFGYASTFGNAFGEGSGNLTRETMSEGFGDVAIGSSFNAGNCGDCADGAFTGFVIGEGLAGHRSASSVFSDGGYAEGGSTAQTALHLGGDWHALRGSTTFGSSGNNSGDDH